MHQSATVEDVERLGEFRLVGDLVPCPLNPRKSFDEAKLEELAASIASKGILQPLIVRQRAGLAQLEIVAGERRYLAARSVGLDRLPVIIRTLSDVEVLELMAIENSQRDDLHPLEEADGYLALMKADPAYTPKAIAAKIGKSERYVQQRLQLARLDPEVKKAFLANQLTAGHADLISRLKPADQTAARKACFDNLYGEDKERGSISVRQLDRWIKDHVRVDLVVDAPQLPELQKLVDEKKGDRAAVLATILQVSGSYSQTPATKGLMSPSDYRVVEKKQTCGHMRRALIVIGEDRGKLVDVCTAKTSCKVHWKHLVEEVERATKARQQPASKGAQAGARARAQMQRAAAKDRARRELAERKVKVWQHILDKVAPKVVPNKPTPALLKLFGFWSNRTTTWRDVTIEAMQDIGGYQLTDPKKAARIVKVLKPLGIDLLAVERELFPSAKPGTQTSAPKAGASRR
jgi:ParB/RepB/Spo0J family partition protein